METAVNSKYISSVYTLPLFSSSIMKSVHFRRLRKICQCLFQMKIKTLVYSNQRFTLKHFIFYITMLRKMRGFLSSAWEGFFPMLSGSQSTINSSAMPSKFFLLLALSISCTTISCKGTFFRSSPFTVTELTVHYSVSS